jgi:FkbM family methyltransferase
MSEIIRELEIISELYQKNPNLNIFDIGAHGFHDSITFKTYFPQSTIYAFEPDMENLQAYRSQAETNGILVAPVAMSDIDGKIRFYPSLGHTASGSTLKPKVVEGTRSIKGYETFEFDLNGYLVRTIRFDTFCRLNNIKQVDYVHMDVQGGEYKVISSLGEHRPHFIFAETCAFNDYDTKIDLKDFDNLLENLGYKIHTRFPGDTLYYI